MTLSPAVHVWSAILFVAVLAVIGEVMIASGMRQLGDLDDIRASRGLGGAIVAVLTNARFVIGALCMALNFFSMLFALSIANLSLAGPAIAALTYVGMRWRLSFSCARGWMGGGGSRRCVWCWV